MRLESLDALKKKKNVRQASVCTCLVYKKQTSVQNMGEAQMKWPKWVSAYGALFTGPFFPDNGILVC